MTIIKIFAVCAVLAQITFLAWIVPKMIKARRDQRELEGKIELELGNLQDCVRCLRQSMDSNLNPLDLAKLQVDVQLHRARLETHGFKMPVLNVPKIE